MALSWAMLNMRTAVFRLSGKREISMAMNKETKTATRNTFMLYLMNIAKMVFPLLTLPYLTRVLSVPVYGVVTYVKATMQYMQLLLAFGFALSATKKVVNAHGDKVIISRILGDVQAAKLLLTGIGGAALAVLTICIPILRQNVLFVVLSYVNVVITEMLADFLFHGLDRMEVLTIRFVTAKLIATVCTFLFIKNDSHLMLIPVFDCLGSLVALVLVLWEIKKLELRFAFTGFREALRMLKESATFFVSDMATTAFGAMNTLMIGFFSSSADVAYWGVVMQLVGAVNAMYTPITNGVYPTMIRTKSLGFIKKIMMLIMPVVTVGCLICWFGAELIVTIVGGAEYLAAAPVFRGMVPVMFMSFGVQLFAWPTLGPIGKIKETTATTVITAVTQLAGLVVLVLAGRFTLLNIALLRCLTEFMMLAMRLGICFHFRHEYNP